ncbi:GntR family transcriptional regulator [Muricomes intestini]|jgi:GntR family transcriptional regulator|uniref:GntR family transcriptional regulator n=3 Tax=Muricomes intestini TaxID=1796634 RepID=A0A4R3KD09_9FIRM|nr:GntR family transcriptional regulator [Muricomes intestini]TCS81126.1 GntR family transcriptional regulator [Muricomes intestini]HAX50975.1 GntR family transcriptional regulator [Lachnospiraceae bacterium]HCR84266.1 GntR family transcriptional regulator [Lachnospiraceae bacterium]
MLDKVEKINKSVPIPLYFQLKELILAEIKEGNYKSGDMIPTEKDISDTFQISRTTVRQAITELVQEGWLYRVKSKGTFVSQPKITQEYIRKIESFNDQMYRMGVEPSTEVLELKTMKGMEAGDLVVKALEIAENDSVIFLYRKRMADGEPIVTTKTYLPFSECEFLLTHDLNTEQLYSILSQKEETRIFRIERTVEAIEAKAEDVKLLQMKRGKPIQYFISTGYNAYGKPIEYTLSRYRGDRNKFEVTVFPENKS